MAPTAPPVPRRLLHFPLPGGVDAVRLPSTIVDQVLDEALRSDAPWLLLDASGAEEGGEAVAHLVAAALVRSSRTAARTCVVCHRHVPAFRAAGVATFTTVEDACQARLFDDAGFGAGWAVPTPMVVDRSRPVAL